MRDDDRSVNELSTEEACSEPPEDNKLAASVDISRSTSDTKKFEDPTFPELSDII